MYLGDIVKGKMVLNEYGAIANQFWLDIPSHFPNVELDEFIIMPNHIHGIIILNETRRDVASNVSTESKIKNEYYFKLSPNKNSLSVVIRSYKSAVTHVIHKSRYHDFQWQSRFYDRIIRNEKELYRIRQYIQ